MLWFNLGFSDFIKKRVCKFLLNRYLGQFFQEKLTVDQICLDLYNGKGSVSDVKLCCEVKVYNFFYTNFSIIIILRVPKQSILNQLKILRVTHKATTETYDGGSEEKKCKFLYLCAVFFFSFLKLC